MNTVNTSGTFDPDDPKAVADAANSGSAGAGYPGHPLPTLDLRPLSTGELLDRVFFLYRSRVLMFLAIAMVPALLSMLGQSFQYFGVHPVAANLGTVQGAGALQQMLASLTGSIALLATYLLILFGAALAQAATTRLVEQLYLGRTGQPGVALRSSLSHLFRYVGIQLWQIWSAMWLPFLLGAVGGVAIVRKQLVVGGLLVLLALASVVYGVIAYLRNTLAIPAAVMEELSVRKAMRRSKTLMAGRKGRVFLLFLLLMLLYLVGSAIQMPLVLLIVKAKAPTQHMVAIGLELTLSFVITCLLTPVASIALCLFYFDARVRSEGFDIDFMLRGTAAVSDPEALRAGAPAAQNPAQLRPEGQ